MKVLMIDADGKDGNYIFPNLALMKLSRYHKNQGDEVKLQNGLEYPWWRPDKVYISCVFFQNKEKSEELARRLDVPVEIGGSGYDITKWLSREIEHLMPDYDLYGIDYSMGFTSRGCIRNCPFCIVHDKEGGIRNHAPISEFHNPEHDKLILMDSNFSASPRKYENLDYIVKRNLKVNFNEGWDIRVLDRELAEALAQVQYYSWKFNRRAIHLAFDTMGVESRVREAFELLESVGIPMHHLTVYVLVGFNTTLEQDLYRVRVIHDEYGALPFIQVFNKRRDRQDLLKLARWVNRRYYKFIPWDKFKYERPPSNSWTDYKEEMNR